MPRHKSARQATAVATLYLAYRDIQHTGSVRSQAAPMQTFHFFSFHSHGLLPLRICTWGEIQGMPPAGSRPEFWSGVALLYRLSQRKQWAPSNGLGRLRREGSSRGAPACAPIVQSRYLAWPASHDWGDHHPVFPRDLGQTLHTSASGAAIAVVSWAVPSTYASWRIPPVVIAGGRKAIPQMTRDTAD